MFVKELNILEQESMISFLKKEPMYVNVVKLLCTNQILNLMHIVDGQLLMMKLKVP